MLNNRIYSEKDTTLDFPSTLQTLQRLENNHTEIVSTGTTGCVHRFMSAPRKQNKSSRIVNDFCVHS
jgi:hypothetical protein